MKLKVYKGEILRCLNNQLTSMLDQLGEGSDNLTLTLTHPEKNHEHYVKITLSVERKIWRHLP